MSNCIRATMPWLPGNFNRHSPQIRKIGLLFTTWESWHTPIRITRRPTRFIHCCFPWTRPGQRSSRNVKRHYFLRLKTWFDPLRKPKQTTDSVMRNSCRSEEHTSELQSHHDLVCRLLLEKKKNNNRSD